ncbi:hypothetical protein HG264_03475 [Pseudomonas sp. gcc21]|uniref:hypothetical protein n=1 Tax=Pseudomonas sp. gcc21 TaxID=2726989 RepID=UPI0014513680|nr:hypothetical protein [Pseudomonas sp. gcc21]QJD58032.1 hypothetical protein HG264_03475 [Pseudomonas sp. gcc21]
MATLKLLATAVTFASIGLCLPVSAHDHNDAEHGTETSMEHQSPAANAGGTPGDKGVGGSVAVPGSDTGAEETTPYTDVGEDVEEPRDDRELDDVTHDRNND